MRVFYGFDALPRFSEPAVTVGSFDGVHLGHQALLARLCEEARATGGESIVLTFDPHPRITLGRTDGFRQLTTLDEKLALKAASIIFTSFASLNMSYALCSLMSERYSSGVIFVMCLQ